MNIIGNCGGTFVGGSQEWYEDIWQKKSGCGPVTASNLIWYMTRMNSGFADYMSMMLEMFTFVTPSMQGVNTSKIFSDGVTQYGVEHGMDIGTKVLEVPSWPRKRPDIIAASEFIETALSSDSPIAFLNLSNGTLENLESWHWVTLISFDSETKQAGICDHGIGFDIDFAQWLATSKLGGAMVYLVFDR